MYFEQQIHLSTQLRKQFAVLTALRSIHCITASFMHRVATKRGVGHGLSYGLPVVNFIEQFTHKSLEILNIIKHKCEGMALVTAKIRIRYILALKHKE